MQIQLKQPEIEAALKMYIASQGISLAGKTFSVSFTSGRKDNGLSADLVIEDTAIPGYTDTYALHPVGNPVPVAANLVGTIVPMTPAPPSSADAQSAETSTPAADASDAAQVTKPKLFS